MGQIRSFTPDDAAAVAGLFQTIFRRGGTAPPGLADYLVQAFCNHPWADPEIASQVHVDGDGAVTGFIGVIAMRLVHRGAPCRAAVIGSLMVDPRRREPLAGARLLRSVLAGPQELSISETANPLSLAMWERLGARMVPARSLELVKVLRPAGFALALAGRRFPAAMRLAPLMRPFDALLGRVAARPAAPARPAAAQAATVAPRELADIVRAVAERRALRPAFDERILAFHLDHAARKMLYGEALARRIEGRDGRAVGGYLAHGRRGAPLRLTQIFAQPQHAEAVVADLVAEARRLGAVAVTGRAQPDIMGALLTAGCLFVHRAATVALARDADLLSLVAGEDSFLNGVAGELWLRLIGDSFDAAETASPAAVNQFT